MKTTIDAAGRVVVPKTMRERLGIEGRSEVDIEVSDGVIEIRPPEHRVTVELADDGKLVLVAPAGTPPMTDEDVRRAIDESRQWPRVY